MNKSSTNLITVPGDDDVQLRDLTNWALTISWCSNAIIDVFYDTSLQDVSRTSLRLFRGDLTTPEDAEPDTTYWYYTKPFVLCSGVAMVDKTTFAMEATPYGTGSRIFAETTVNADAETPHWYRWYDTDWMPADALCGTEQLAPVRGQVGQIRIGIHTDMEYGFGGEVNYVAFLTDPDLFGLEEDSPVYGGIDGGNATTNFD